MLTKEKAIELYDYKNGSLFWKKSSGCIKSGDTVGCYSHGYKVTSFRKKRYYIHQIVFLLHHGYIPKLIDHIDGNKENNDILNLREATKSQNACNSKMRLDNTTGHKGVVWHKKAKKWLVRVSHNKITENIGLFDDFEFACFVSDEARKKYHGEFVNI